MSLKAIIIDDERRSRSSLQKLIKMTSQDVEVIGMYSNAQDGYEAIVQDQPELVFLDIRMPGESGFDLLERFEDFNFNVVFTTAYNEYAIAALKCGAVDYLLKPISVEELEIALLKAHKLSQNNQSHQNFCELIELIKFNSQNSGKIPVADLHGIKFIDADSIIRCSADNNYTKIHLDNAKVLLASKTLKDYETLLTRYGFFRCHRSHLINLRHIVEYKKGKTGLIKMKDNKEVELAHTKKSEFYRLFS